MKSLLILQFAVLLLNNIKCARIASQSMTLTLEQIAQANIATLWEKLFTANRLQTCAAEVMKRNVMNVIARQDGEGSFDGKKGSSAEFAWVKKWGYGDAAYLFDFFDPVLQTLAVTEFKKLYDDLMALPNKDTKDYQDLLDINKLINSDTKHLGKNINFKHLNKNYDPALYSLSVNTVQLNTAMKKWNWLIEPGQQDYAFDFVMKYDFNGDGRLNPRELIIGAIMHNRNDMVSGGCQNCLQGIGKTLDAMFLYLDCTNAGFLSAEDLWHALPKLNRGTERWNIFSIKNSGNIRTSAINDFVIKNGMGKEGSVSRDEFRIGALLGYWDRQTSTKSIIPDDSRNLKELRWDRTGTKDTVAWKYYEEKVRAELIAKKQK